MMNYNNPGNIEIQVGIPWQGQIIPGDSLRFVTFSTPAYGYRALFKDITTKIYNGYNTIRKIITRYAPPSDNNPTENYINFVSITSGINANEVISPGDSDAIYKVGQAIARFETGETPQQQDIEQGFNMAFGGAPVTPPSNQFPSMSKNAKVAFGLAALLLFLSND